MATLNEKRLKNRGKKRIAIYMIMTLLFIGILPELSYILHQVLSKGISSRIDINYSNAMRLLINDTKVQQISLILALLFIAFLLYLSMEMRQQISKVDTVQITPDINIPVKAGNGQYGNARFLKDSEKRVLYKMYKYSADIETDLMPEIDGKGGLVVHYEAQRKSLFNKRLKEKYYYIGNDFHSIIVSTTGGGKSRSLLLPTLALQIQSGLSIVVTDVKGELWCYTSKYAESKGYKTNVIDFRTPKKSMHYNFMQPILDALKERDEATAVDYTWDLVSVLVGEPKGEPLWANGESASIAAAILAVAMEAPEECRNLTNVYYFLSYMCKTDERGSMPISKFLMKLPEDHPARTCFAMAEIAPNRTRGSFFTSALGTLRLFVNQNIAAMSAKSNFKLKDIGREKTILYIKIPDEKKTYYPLVSLLVTQIYMEQVALANENGQRLPVNTDYDLDEIGNCPVIPVLPPMITAGRSRGMRVNLFVQDYQQLSKYKDDSETILSNCSVKVFLKGDSEKTLKTISESIGKYTVEVSSASTSISDGKRMNTNYSSSSNLAGRNILEPTEIKMIKPPYALVMMTGEYSAINILPDISKTRINDLYGMGDEEHNKKLIMKRESEVNEIFVKKIPLWGIWNRYAKDIDEDDHDEDDQEISAAKRVSFLNFSEDE